MSKASLSSLPESPSSRARPMPVPRAMIRTRISSLESILSNRAFSTLRILPLRGRMAWKRRSRPCLAEPPAESPSTMNSSLWAGSFSEQSASLPGSEPLSRALLRRGLGLVQVLDERHDPALVPEDLLLGRLLAFVLERDLQALVQEGQLAQTLGQDVEAELRALEDFGVRLERDLGAAPFGLA